MRCAQAGDPGAGAASVIRDDMAARPAGPSRPTTHLMSPVRQPARKPVPSAGPRASPLQSSAPPQVIHKFDFLTNPPCAPVPVPVISFLRKRAPHTARSSSGSGRRPLKAEITSSNLVRATKCSTRVARSGFFVGNPSVRYRLSRLKGRLLCFDPRPGNTTVPTPSGRRPTPTRSRSPRPSPTRSRPTAPIPSPLKAGRRSRPHAKLRHRIASMPKGKRPVPLPRIGEWTGTGQAHVPDTPHHRMPTKGLPDSKPLYLQVFHPLICRTEAGQLVRLGSIAILGASFRKCRQHRRRHGQSLSISPGNRLRHHRHSDGF